MYRNPLISRIWDGFTNSAQDELLAMIGEFRLDYALEDTFLYGLDIVEEAVIEEDYERAYGVFEDIYPIAMRRIDVELFRELLSEAYLAI